MQQESANEHLDVYEQWAHDSLEPLLGPIQVTDCRGGPEGKHDFEARLAEGRVAAIEVTSVVEPARLSVEAELLRRDLSRLELPELASGWAISLADDARVKDATRPEVLRQLLSEIEARGLRYAHDLGDFRDPLTKELQSLGIASVYRLGKEKAGTVLVMAGAYGGAGWDGQAIDLWLEGFIASPQGVNKLGKLGRAEAAERHLAIVLDSFSQPGMGIYLMLTARHERGAADADYGVPSFSPPDPVTHIWLLPMVQSGEKLRWARGSGWVVLPGGHKDETAED